MSIEHLATRLYSEVNTLGSYYDFGILPINIDTVNVSNFISDKLALLFDWLAGVIDGFNVYFDLMWNKLGLENFADAILD
jgi:hypothetical protein